VAEEPATNIGSSEFNVRVNTHFADEGVIDMYAEYLERQFDLDQTFVAVLELEKDKAQREWVIKVEVSQATFGYLHHPSNEEICRDWRDLMERPLALPQSSKTI
jgi:hypothetical protein